MSKTDLTDKINILNKLVRDFSLHERHYKTPHYNEANTRADFIDKFFELLGWDISNKQGYSRNYREVVREDTIHIADKPKAPDYSFRIGGSRQFFVEAKKPSVDIKTEIVPAYQLRRYGYTAKLPVSILTDFEELAIYDTRIKPSKRDHASTARLFYSTYKDYPAHFRFLYGILNKENIKRGNLNAYIEHTLKKGTSEVDREFLKLIEHWRQELAKNIARLNPRLNIYRLNYAVQKIIDRIIFLRIAEDRGTEKYGLLIDNVHKQKAYQHLYEIFVTADKKYNGGLFKQEEIFKTIRVDDKVIKNIIDNMYYPDSPYEFSVMPVEVLGSIYERFLGKTIRLTKGHQARVEEKPEVRKAGGVYYTPKYIVDYIVSGTVGEKIKNKKPAEITDLKILDPACGSGSFLIGAYDYLLKHHLDFYIKPANKNSASKQNKIYQDEEGEFHLSISEKQKILLNNIYGVDIDPQAVEVTKLSLLLKLMEGEELESAGELFKHSDFKYLPDLSGNIKCGNSLIGSDFYSGKQLDMFGTDDMHKINAFDWDREFPFLCHLRTRLKPSSVNSSRNLEKNKTTAGFDCIIGNPPYVDSEKMVKTNTELRDYCAQKYAVAKGNWDMFCVFSEKAITLLKNNGLFGFIIPNKFISAKYGDYLKKYFSQFKIINIIDYSEVTVFKSDNKRVSIYPLIIIVSKNRNAGFGRYVKMRESKDKIYALYEKNFRIRQDENDWTTKFSQGGTILKKITENSYPLSTVATIESAATVSEAYEIKKIIRNRKSNLKNVFRFVNTGTVDRYLILWGKKDTRYIKSVYSHPTVFRNSLKDLFPRRFKQSMSEKLILAGMVEKLEASYDKGEILAGKSTTLILNKNKFYSLKFICGILNSKISTFIFRTKNRHTSMAGGYLNVNKNNLVQLPIPKLDFLGKEEKSAMSYLRKQVSSINAQPGTKRLDSCSGAEMTQRSSKTNKQSLVDKQTHDKIVNLVDQMLKVQANLHRAKSETDKKYLSQKAEILDRQIDELVYKMYGLTKEEIRIVDGEE